MMLWEVAMLEFVWPASPSCFPCMLEMPSVHTLEGLHRIHFFSLKRCIQNILSFCQVCCSSKTSFYCLCFRKVFFFVLARSMQSQLNTLRWRLFCGWILSLTKQSKIPLDFDAPEVTLKWISIIEFCVHGLTTAFEVTMLETMTISFCISNTKGRVKEKSSVHPFHWNSLCSSCMVHFFFFFYWHDFILPCFSYLVCNFK